MDCMHWISGFFNSLQESAAVHVPPVGSRNMIFQDISEQTNKLRSIYSKKEYIILADSN